MQVCMELGIKARHVFACDTYGGSKKFIQANFEVGQWIHNVFDEEFKEAPSVDVFTAGFPCQPYSSAGIRLGARDSRSDVLTPILDYITKKEPKVVIFENVVALIHSPNKPVYDLVLRTLDRGGYEHWTKVLNSLEHGVPQRRLRVYIVAIRRSELVGPI